MKQKWVADDGKEFDNYEKCRDHEELLARSDPLAIVLHRIGVRDSCSECSAPDWDMDVRCSHEFAKYIRGSWKEIKEAVENER